VFKKVMKWVLILASVVALLPVALALTWQYGHPMNFPVAVPHDFSKQGHKSEHQIRLSCGWLIVCDSVPYDIELVLPEEGNSRFIAKILGAANSTDLSLPGRYRITVVDDETSQMVFDDVVIGVKASHLHVFYKSKQKQIKAYTEPLKKLWAPAGRYKVSVENLESITDFDQPIGKVVIKWARK
jgi:hypothetical protein